MADADEGRKTPFDALMVVVCQSSPPKLPMAVDTAVSYPVHVVVYAVPSLRRPPVLLVRQRIMRGGKLQALRC